MIKLPLAAMAGLLPQVEAVKQPPTAPPRKLNLFFLKVETKAALPHEHAFNLVGGLT